MNIKKYSFRYAEEILSNPKYKSVLSEILSICQNCPLPYYPNKSTKQPKLDIVQQIINTYFLVAFVKLGWKDEPYASPSEFKDALRSDFRKTFVLDYNEKLTVQVEVEMGNAASSYRNYFKIQLSYANDLTNIGLVIVPCSTLGTRIDSGVANFEKCVREIPSAKLSLTVPIFVIGLDDVDSELWDLRKITKNIKEYSANSKKAEKKRKELIEEYLNKTNY